MNWIDFAIIIVTAAVAFVAYKHGIISMVFTFGGFFVGVFLASRHHSFLGDGEMDQVIAFIIVVVVVLVVANVLGAIIKRLLHTAQLGWADKLAAVALGVVVGLFICAGVLAVVAKATTFTVGEDIPVGEQEVHQAVTDSQDWASENISESYLAGALLGKFPVVRALLPGDFDFLKNFFT